MSSSAISSIPVSAGDYTVVVGHGLLREAQRWIPPRSGKTFIISDSCVQPLYGPTLQQQFPDATTITIPAGEHSKSWAQLTHCVDTMLAAHIDRQSTILALGGGVVGDLAGFAAAIVLRGVRLIHIPTTLLAHVDSAIGGKTAIDVPLGKNLVGAFYNPALVLADTATLTTLPPRQQRAGYGEVIKYGLLHAPLFQWLETHDALAPENLQEAIRQSIQIKVDIIDRDPLEITGERALLNLGHTFAHAYETLTGFSQNLLHGEAVSIGLCDAFRLAQRMGCVSPEDVQRVHRHVQHSGLPCALPDRLRANITPEAVLKAMRHDKKAAAGQIRFIVPEGIGHARQRHDVPHEALMATLREAQS